jgi:hypothetical protein
MNASAKTGCINFPVEGGDYTNTNVGGMYVQLVAVEKRSDREEWWEDAWLDCFGGSNTTLEYQESMVGTDSLVDGRVPYTQEIEDTWDEKVAEVGHATKLLFPYFFDGTASKLKRSRSVALLATVILGSTGGTWMKGDDGWRCTFEDLDFDGQAIVENLRKLYGAKADLHLITWMDEG